MDDTNPEPRVWPNQHNFRHSNVETILGYDDALLIEPDMSYPEASQFPAIQNGAQHSGDRAPDLGRDSPQSFGETQQSSSHQSQQQPGPIQKGKKRSRQPQYTNEDWNSHRLRLHKLYLTDDLSLEMTMSEMKKFGFEPSMKLYKTQFKEWKWFKNLPQETALWMHERYKQRNRPTTFFYGAQEVTLEKIQNVVKRAKTTDDVTTLQNMRTPKELSVFTPAACAPSPAACRHHADALPDLANSVSQTKDDSTSSPPFCKLLQFDWNGHKVEDIRSLAHEARQLHLVGDTLNAEKQLREALGKFQAVLCPTHAETVAVTYNLAALYAEQDRFNDVHVVVDGILEKHVERWGLFHHATITQFVRIIGLLGSWGRRDEAKAISDRLESYLSPETVVGPSGDPGSWNTARTPVAPETEQTTRTNNLNSHQNRFIAPPTATELPALEELFNRLIEDHNRTPDKFNPQILLTFCAIYERCRLADTNEGVVSILDRVRRFVDTILSTRSNMTAPILNACADVAKFYILDDIQTGEDLFQKVAYAAEVTLPADDPAVIQLLIRIGLIYQGHNLWRMAEPWFERALSRSIAVNDLTSAVTKKIEQALEKQHYAESLLDSWRN